MLMHRILDLANPVSDCQAFDAIEKCWGNYPKDRVQLIGLVVFAGLASILGVGIATPLIFRKIVSFGVRAIEDAQILESRIKSIDEGDLFKSYQSLGNFYSPSTSQALFMSDQGRGFTVFYAGEMITSWESLEKKLQHLKDDDKAVILASLSQEGLSPITVERAHTLTEDILPQESHPRIVENFSPENPVRYEISLNRGSPIFKITAPLKMVALDFKGDLPVDREHSKCTVEITVNLSEKTATPWVLRESENKRISSVLPCVNAEDYSIAPRSMADLHSLGLIPLLANL